MATSDRRRLLLAAELALCAAVALWFLLTFFGFTGGMLDDDYTAFDLDASAEVYAVRTPARTTLMHAVSFAGAELTLVLLVVVAAALALRRRLREAVLLVVATVVALALSLVIKDVVGRPRPELSPLAAEDFASYPSGHSLNSFVFYLLLAYLAFHVLESRLAAAGVTLLCVVLVAATGLSRVYLGVHYPTDVMAGWIVGGWWLLVVVAAHRLLLARQRRQT